MKKSWYDGKTVIITGASSGLGKELARKLILEHGCKVTGIARNEERLKQFKESLGTKSDSFSYYTFDVSVKENWKSFAKEIEEDGLKPDILINNAGILPKFDKFANYTTDDTEKVMNINFYSCIYSVNALLPIILKSSSATIINIASSAALCSLAGTSVYSASKAAVKSFTDALREEYRGECYVGLICPGFTKTNIFCNQEAKIEGAAEKAINLISTDCEKMARLILFGIRHKFKDMVFGKDAHFMSVGNKLFGVSCSHISSFVMKKSRIALFEKVFRK